MVNRQKCALLHYDSGISSFKMILTPIPNFEVITVGGSHYLGDIYKSLDSGWVQKATLTEFVISETAVPMQPQKFNSVVERQIEVNNIPKPNFSRE